jgi:hypothetical protein
VADAVLEGDPNPFVAAEQVVSTLRAPGQPAAVLADTSRGVIGFAGAAA